jgi:hypothetical protein
MNGMRRKIAGKTPAEIREMSKDDMKEPITMGDFMQVRRGEKGAAQAIQAWSEHRFGTQATPTSTADRCRGLLTVAFRQQEGRKELQACPYMDAFTGLRHRHDDMGSDSLDTFWLHTAPLLYAHTPTPSVHTPM